MNSTTLAVDVPVRWLSGTADPVLTPDLIDGYAEHISDFEVELVDGVGHWIVEQRPDLVLDRLRAFFRRSSGAIAEQRNRGLHRGLDDVARAVPVFDHLSRQLTQTADQDHGLRLGQRRQVGVSHRRGVAQAHQQAGQQLGVAPLRRPRRGVQ